MNILNKLTVKSLKMNKSRTLVTMVGIILSCALITGTVTLAKSFRETILSTAKNSTGNYHIKFSNVSNENAKYIENNKEIKSFYTTKELGYSKLEGSKNEYKPYIFVEEYNEDAFENSSIKLVKGRFPENSNEIVIPDHILYNAELDIKISDKLNLNFAKRFLNDKNGEKIDQRTPIMIQILSHLFVQKPLILKEI